MIRYWPLIFPFSLAVGASAWARSGELWVGGLVAGLGFVFSVIGLVMWDSIREGENDG